MEATTPTIAHLTNRPEVPGEFEGNSNNGVGRTTFGRDVISVTDDWS